MSELEERIARIIPLRYRSNHRVPDSRPEQPSPQPTPEPSPSPQLAPTPQPTPSNPTDEKLVKQVIRKVLMAMYLRRMESHVIFLPRSFQQKLLQVNIQLKL